MARPQNPAGNIRYIHEIARKQFKKQSQYLLTLQRTDVEDSILTGVLPNGTHARFDADTAANYTKHPQDCQTALQALRAYRLRIGATPVNVITPGGIVDVVEDVTPDLPSKPKVRIHKDTRSAEETQPDSKIDSAVLIPAEKGCMIFGPRGSGKSTAIRHLAKLHQKSTITLQCAANMQLDSLIGVWTAIGGNTVFVDGPLTIAVREGKWLLAEEANAIHPGVWSAVNTLTDRTGDPLLLPTGESITPHPDFRLVLLFNEGSQYAGTRDVNAALKRRLVPVYATYPDRPTETAILHDLLAGTATVPFTPTAWFPMMAYALTSNMTPTMLDQSRQNEILTLAESIRKSTVHFDLSTDVLARWIRVKFALNLSWFDSFSSVILDMLGTPEITGPDREILTGIARSANMENWTN